MKLYRIVDKSQDNITHWTSDYSLIEDYLKGYSYCSSAYNNKDRIFVESITIPDNLEPELEEAYEWNKNKLTTITKTIY
jgi:hypothetical protein